MKKMLLLGGSGKLGTAIQQVFAPRWTLRALSSQDFDAAQPDSLLVQLEDFRPDLIVNCVAYLGIDPSEADPQAAFCLNALLPRYLVGLAARYDCPLVHFSTDAVFSGEKKAFLSEQDCPDPVNLYGVTKLSGDQLITAGAIKHYILRISLLFGPSSKQNQFVEKMLERIRNGQTELQIAADIVASPSYAPDVARQLLEIVAEERPWGLYHVANDGQASLYELMKELCRLCAPAVQIRAASHQDFAAVGRKNDFTPLRSVKLKALRPWQDALADYAATLDMNPRTGGKD